MFYALSSGFLFSIGIIRDNSAIQSTLARLLRVGVTFSAAQLARDGVVLRRLSPTNGASRSSSRDGKDIVVFAARALGTGVALPVVAASSASALRHRFRQFFFEGCPEPVHFEVRATLHLESV